MKSIVEIHEGVAPKIAPKLLVGDQFAGRLEQRREKPKRQILEFQPPSLLAQLASRGVEFKQPEANLR